MQEPNALQAKRVLAVQATLTLALSAAGYALGENIALSILIGAGSCTLATGVFAVGIYGRYRAVEPGALVMRFYAAEIIKLVVILALFGVAFALIDGLNPPALLGAYFLVQVLPVLLASYWDAVDKNVRK